MARISGPLMSFAAAGSVGSTATYRTLAGRAVAQRWASPRAAPTDAQNDIRNRGKWAAANWPQLDQKARTRWLAAAAAASIPTFAFYLREFILQNCGQFDQPLIPA